MTTAAAAPPRATFMMCSARDKGHLLGVLDLAQGLVARGHRVLVYTDAAARGDVEAAGAELVPFQRHEIGGRMMAVEKAAEQLPRRQRRSYIARNARRALFDSVMDMIQDLEPVLRSERVDCMLTDQTVCSAAYAAEKVGIPVASISIPSFIMDSQGLPLFLRVRMPLLRKLGEYVPGLLHWLAEKQAPLRSIREELGLPPREGSQAEILRLMASPQLHIVFIHPGLLKGHQLRDHQLFAGTITFTGQAQQDAQQPLSPPLAPGTVLVSTTTVGGKDRGLLRRVLEAVAPMGLPVLATSAGSTDVPEGLGPHIRVERFVSHEQVLPLVAALVTHGGAGVVGRALRHGVPMLIIPLFVDQPVNAHLTEAQGLAYHLPFSRATPGAIRDRLRALLEDQALRERLKQVSAEIRQSRAKEEVLEALERLALGNARREAA